MLSFFAAAALATSAPAQQPDTAKPIPLTPITVSVTRAEVPLERVPWAVQAVHPAEIARGRPSWGLDEVLSSVPGVVVANRYNFSLDQRVSIRGFGARSAFAVRGVKVLLDGIPLTLPDGQGQLTTIELGAIERIEVLRGSSSAMFGNAAGGVISLTTDEQAVGAPWLEARTLAGSFDRDLGRTWSKWQAEGGLPLGSGALWLSASRLAYAGERDHTAADQRTLNARARLGLGQGWVLTLLADVGDDPRADNPGALTAAELRVNRDSAAALNLLRNAGKAVRQAQGGASLRGSLGTAEVAVSAFALARDLRNPLPQAFIDVGRTGWGGRSTIVFHRKVFARPVRFTAGADAQRQRDARHEWAYRIPNGSLTTPDNTTDTLTRDQLERVAEVGPFVQAMMDVSPRASVTAGLRYDRVTFAVHDRLVSDGADNSGSRMLDATSGSLDVALLPGKSVTVYGNVSTSYETPTTTELNNQPPPGGGGFNLNLDPQRATSVEIGTRGQWPGGWSWSGAVYTADVRDELVAFEDTLVPGRRYFRNAARATHRGIELGAGGSIGPASIALAWTFADFRYRSHREGAAVLDGRAIAGIPRSMLRASARVEPSWSHGGWLALDVSTTSGVFVDDTLNARTDPWTQIDVRLGCEVNVLRGRLAPVFGVNNLLNAHYVSSVTINAARGRYYEPAPGRNAYVGVQLTAPRANVGAKQGGGS